MRKRNVHVQFWLDKKEAEAFNKKVKRSGLSREELLRSLIRGVELRARPCEHHADLLHKAAGLCNNANQLARVANTYGEANQQSVDEMTRIARAVWEEVRDKW